MKPIVYSAAELIESNFYFDELSQLLPQQEDQALIQLKNALAERIAYMLDHDFELLMQIFYKIDLKESSVQQAITGGIEGEPSMILADLVIERQIQKAETRRKYRPK